jgi:UDP-2,3-diacylglucosamine pyrophosphatase LpxH
MDLEKNKNYFEIPSDKEFRVFTASDLHLFGNYLSEQSTKDHDEIVWRTLEYALADKGIDAIVLNGDIIEGYQTFFSEEALKEKIENFVKKLNEKNTRNIPIFYVVGNHDDKQYMVEKLEELSKNTPNFYVFREFLVIGNEKTKVLFTHGDFLLRKGCDLFNRELGAQGEHSLKPAFIKENLYQNLYPLLGPAIQLFVDRTQANPKYVTKTILEKIFEEYPQIYKLIEKGVLKAIMTGHTHEAFNENVGIIIGNSGTAVESRRLSPLILKILGYAIDLEFYREVNDEYRKEFEPKGILQIISKRLASYSAHPELWETKGGGR